MGGHDGPTLVLAPLPEELRALRQRLTPIERVHVPGLRRACRGSLQGSPTVLAVTGDGERKALRGIETALATFRPSHLLVIGVAGALTPELDVGDVIAARQVLQPDGQPREPSHELLARAVESGIPAGTVLTTTRLATTPEEKARLAVQPGVAAPAVVDLESAFYAQAADAAGVPWLVLRAVSDTATESLPPYLERCRDEGGAVQRGRVALQGLLRPWSLPVLLRLGRRVRLCSETLAEILIRMKSGSVGRSEGEAARHRRM
jgi:adenosylhomocysteine nucleosidase